MTDRVNPSPGANVDSYETAGVIAEAGGTDGYITSSPSDLSVNSGSITQGSLDQFSISTSASSFDVTIAPGEAFVYGAWVVRDSSTAVTITKSSTETVYVGWDTDSPDTALIGTSNYFDSDDPKIPLFDVTTDGSGVTNSVDRRQIGRPISASVVDVDEIIDGAEVSHTGELADLADLTSHSADSDAHHTRYSDSEAVSAVESHGDALSVDVMGDADTLDGTHLSNIDWGNTALSQSDVNVSDLGVADAKIYMGYEEIRDGVINHPGNSDDPTIIDGSNDFLTFANEKYSVSYNDLTGVTNPDRLFSPGDRYTAFDMTSAPDPFIVTVSGFSLTTSDFSALKGYVQAHGGAEPYNDVQFEVYDSNNTWQTVGTVSGEYSTPTFTDSVGNSGAEGNYPMTQLRVTFSNKNSTSGSDYLERLWWGNGKISPMHAGTYLPKKDFGNGQNVELFDDLDMNDYTVENLSLQNVNSLEMDGDIYGAGIDVHFGELSQITTGKNGEPHTKIRGNSSGQDHFVVNDGGPVNTPGTDLQERGDRVATRTWTNSNTLSDGDTADNLHIGSSGLEFEGSGQISHIVRDGDTLNLVADRNDDQGTYAYQFWAQGGPEDTNGRQVFSFDNKGGGLEYEGGKVWHEGNDGSGSGLNADLLDGRDEGDFMLTDGSRAFTGAVSGVSPSSQSDLATKGYVDSNVQGLDWQESVIDQDLNTPPGSPSTGDRYIVGDAPTDAWSSNANDIAEWDGSSWVFSAKEEGTATWVEDEDVIYTYNGTSWIQFGSNVDHGNTSGLGDDDHTQYVHVDGRRSITGDQTVEGRIYADNHGFGGSPAIALAVGDSDTGLHSDTDGRLEFWTNNNERMSLTGGIFNSHSAEIQEYGNRVATRTWANSNFVSQSGGSLTDTLEFDMAQLPSEKTGIKLTGGSNPDARVWQVTEGNYGFWTKYRGSSTGNDNALELYAENNGSPIRVWEVLQDGTTDFQVSLSEQGERVATQPWVDSGYYDTSSDIDIGTRRIYNSGDNKELDFGGGRITVNGGLDIRSDGKFRDGKTLEFGTDIDFDVRYDSGDDELIWRSNGMDLIRQPKSGPTKFINGIDAGTIEAPEDSYTQLVNASSTSSATAGDKLGYTFAIDNRTGYSVEAEADGSGGLQRMDHIWKDVGGNDLLRLHESGFVGLYDNGTTTLSIDSGDHDVHVHDGDLTVQDSSVLRADGSIGLTGNLDFQNEKLINPQSIDITDTYGRVGLINSDSSFVVRDSFNSQDLIDFSSGQDIAVQNTDLTVQGSSVMRADGSTWATANMNLGGYHLENVDQITHADHKIKFDQSSSWVEFTDGANNRSEIVTDRVYFDRNTQWFDASHGTLVGVGADDHHIAHEHPGDRPAEADVDITGHNLLVDDGSNIKVSGSNEFSLDLQGSGTKFHVWDGSSMMEWVEDGGINVNRSLNMSSNPITMGNYSIEENTTDDTLDFNYAG